MKMLKIPQKKARPTHFSLKMKTKSRKGVARKGLSTRDHQRLAQLLALKSFPPQMALPRKNQIFCVHWNLHSESRQSGECRSLKNPRALKGTSLLFSHSNKDLTPGPPAKTIVARKTLVCSVTLPNRIPCSHPQPPLRTRNHTSTTLWRTCESQWPQRRKRNS